MNTVLLLAATAALGIDVGYQPIAGGGVEYIIQIEPQLLSALASGQDLTSEVPEELDVRRYRITVGNARLPREMPAEPALRSRASEEPPSEAPRLADDRPIEVTTESQTPTPRMAIEPAAPPANRVGPRYASEPSASPVPRTLEPAPTTNSLFNRPVNFDDPQSAEHQAEKRPSLVPESQSASKSDRPQLENPAGTPTSESKPWLPLLLTTFVLFMSLGGNVYLGWIAWSARGKYLALVEKFRAAPAV